MPSAIKPGGNKVEFFDFFPVLDATVIAEGDLLWWDSSSNSVKPANSFTWVTDAPTTRKRFRRYFVGVAGESHFSQTSTTVGPANKIIKVLTLTEALCSQAAANAQPGQYVGPDSAASLLLNQQIIVVQDPTESVGEVARYYGTSVAGAPVLSSPTQILAWIRAVYSHPWTRFDSKSLKEVAIMTIPASGTTFVLAESADLFFGGAAEVLKMTWMEQVAITVNPLIIRITKNSAGAAVVFATDFNVPTAGAAIGRIFTQDYTAEVGRFFDSNDTIDLKVQAVAPGAGQGQLTIVYRPMN